MKPIKMIDNKWTVLISDDLDKSLQSVVEGIRNHISGEIDGVGMFTNIRSFQGLTAVQSHRTSNRYADVICSRLSTSKERMMINIRWIDRTWIATDG